MTWQQPPNTTSRPLLGRCRRPDNHVQRTLAVMVLLVLSTLACPQPLPPEGPTLQNPGFEDGLEGWSQDSFRQFQGLITLDRQTAHGGNVSLRIASQTGTESPWLAQSIAGLRGGATYLLRAWVKGDGQTVPSLAALKIEFLNAAGQRTSGYYERMQPALTGQWQQMEVRAQADPDTQQASILLRLFGRGSVWFDDVELIMTAPPPRIALTPRRQVALPGKDRTFTLLVRLADEWNAEQTPPLEVRLLIPPKDEPYEPPAELKRHDARTFQAVLTVPTLVPGAYQVQCNLQGTADSARAWVFVPPEKRKPKYLSDTGALLVAGQPFFPIGLYHVSTQDYAEIAKRGFNCVQGSATTELGVLARSLDQARRAQLVLDVPLYAGGKAKANLPVSLRKLNHYRKHPAVLSWKIMDEPDLRPEVMDEVPAVYQALKAADPDHPLVLTVASPDTYDYWANFCDVLQVDPYPLPSHPLTLVGERVARAKQALQPWQNLTAVLQAGWLSDPPNQPTFQQARVMLYLALINGAKGIFWYAYRDPGWDLSQTPLWERFGEINQETALLSKPIMLGTDVQALRVQADGEGLQWLGKQLADKTYVLLVNPGERPLKVTVTPADEPKSATSLEGQPLRVNGGTVTVELQALGAETVILSP